MKKQNNNLHAFLALLKAGLWEKDTYLFPYGEIDFQAIYRLAQEQSVVGTIAAGLEHVVDVKPPQNILLTFIGEALQLEQRNTAMNSFIGGIVEKMQKNGIDSVLIKGQGVAQCYERPLWRASGDVDFLLSPNAYEQCTKFLEELTGKCGEEDVSEKHWEIFVGPWEVELHGRLLSMCLPKMDIVVDEIISKVTTERFIRIWTLDTTTVPLPALDEDIILVFSHLLKHLFRGGVGLRQICDLCRLIWTFRDRINKELLLKRLKKMGIFTEWKVLASFAVLYLDMPAEAMPFYTHSIILNHKSRIIFDYILESGNFGHNRDNSFYYTKSFIVQKMISLSRHTYDGIRFVFVFPMDSLRVWLWKLRNGLKVVFKNNR